MTNPGNHFKLTILSFLLALFTLGGAPTSYGKEGKEVLKLTIRDAIKMAVEKNLSLKFSEIDPKIQLTNIGLEKAEFDPTLFFGIYVEKDRRPFASAFAKPEIGDYFREEWNLGVRQKLMFGAEYDLTLRSRMNDTNSLYAGLDPEYYSEFVFNFSQPLLKGFGADVNTSLILVAKNNKNISDAQFKQLMMDVITNVQTAYWGLVYARENLGVKKGSLNLARDFEKRVRAQVRVGVMAPIEILQAQAEVAAREEEIIVAENELEKAGDTLKEIMNHGADSYDWGKEIEPVDKPSFSASLPDLNDEIAKALGSRPDILEMRLAAKNENIMVKYNENQLYPSLDLVGSLGLNGLSGKAKSFGFGGSTSRSNFGGTYGKSLDRMLGADYYTWKVGINVEYPIGNKKAKNSLSASKLKVEKLLFQLKDLEKKISLEVRNAVRDIKTNVKRVESTRISRRLAEEKLEAEEKKFDAGLSTSFNVLSYQEDLSVQETHEIKAIIDYNLSKVNLQRVVAETLKVLNIKINNPARSQ